MVRLSAIAHYGFDALCPQSLYRKSIAPCECQDANARTCLLQGTDDLGKRGLRAATLHGVDYIGYPHRAAPFRRVIEAAIALAARSEAGVSDSAKV